MYRYIQIGSDENFSQTCPAIRVLNQIKAIPDCIEDDHHGFKNAAGTPWFRINIARCDEYGNYVTGPSHEEDFANMVELICEDKGGVQSQEYYTQFAQHIAARIGWAIIERGF